MDEVVDQPRYRVLAQQIADVEWTKYDQIADENCLDIASGCDDPSREWQK